MDSAIVAGMKEIVTTILVENSKEKGAVVECTILNCVI
jgi:hypothetical protein